MEETGALVEALTEAAQYVE